MIRKRAIAPIITMLIGLFFSFLVSYSLYQSEKHAAVYELQKDIDRVALAFSRELNVTIDLLYVMQNRVWNADKLNQEIFNHISRKLSKRLPYIDSIRWLTALKIQDRLEYENAMSKLFADYSIRSAIKTLQNEEKNKEAQHNKTHYFPITFTTNAAIAKKLQGLDLLSLDFILDEIETSWYQGIPIATYDTKLQNALVDEQSFFLFFPVFSEEVSTVNERRDKIDGLFLILLDPVAMFESVLGNTIKEPVKLTLQRYSKDEVKVLYENVEGVSGSLIKKMSYSSTPFFFGGKEWQVLGIPSTEYLAQRMTNFPFLIFTLGGGIFVLIAYLVYVLQSRASNIHYQVNVKTRELREANRKLERMSRCDGLTGLFNRAYFDESLDAEVKRAQRDKLPISLLFVEIDNLNEYSVHNGRNAADNTIRLIALALLDKLKRPSDLVARYDHGSFAIILPNTSNGASIANNFIEAVRKLNIPSLVGKKERFVSVSVGGATSIETEKLDAARLKAIAQIALSKAIAQGRDRIQWIFAPETNLENADKPH